MKTVAKNVITTNNDALLDLKYFDKKQSESPKQKQPKSKQLLIKLHSPKILFNLTLA